MRLRRLFSVAFTVGMLGLAGCGGGIPSSRPSVSVGGGRVRRMVDHERHPVTTTTVPWAALSRIPAEIVKYAAGARQAPRPAGRSETVDLGARPAAVRIGTPATLIAGDLWWTDGYNWRALAMCETGQNWHMHGPVYSTAFGIMDGAQEMTPAALNGTASPDEQVRIAIAVKRRAGIRAWGCWRAAG